MIKAFAFVVVLFSQVLALNTAQAMAYPEGPHLEVTPGEVCTIPGQYRYPEKIKYCERNVDSELKREIIRDYDRSYGYRLTQMPREKIKIDHLIPLCMGGSNSRKNLWPQYENVYVITDPLEQLLCEKMSAGRLKQVKAIELIKTAKTNLERARDIIRQAQAL